MISVVVLAKALYSTSVLDLDTIAYFRALQDIILGPKKYSKPTSRSLIINTSYSEKPLTDKEEDLFIVNPTIVVCFKYLNILFTIAQWFVFGTCKNRQTLFTGKEISDHVKVKYCKAPTILLYCLALFVPRGDPS